jgi:hypothetical protein
MCFSPTLSRMTGMRETDAPFLAQGTDIPQGSGQLYGKIGIDMLRPANI